MNILILPLRRWPGADPETVAATLTEAAATGGMAARGAALAAAISAVRAHLDRMPITPSRRREALGCWLAAVQQAEARHEHLRGTAL